jgi:hypothetical protein
VSGQPHCLLCSYQFSLIGYCLLCSCRMYRSRPVQRSATASQLPVRLQSATACSTCQFRYYQSGIPVQQQSATASQATSRLQSAAPALRLPVQILPVRYQFSNNQLRLIRKLPVPLQSATATPATSSDITSLPVQQQSATASQLPVQLQSATTYSTATSSDITSQDTGSATIGYCRSGFQFCYHRFTYLRGEAKLSGQPHCALRLPVKLPVLSPVQNLPGARLSEGEQLH